MKTALAAFVGLLLAVSALADAPKFLEDDKSMSLVERTVASAVEEPPPHLASPWISSRFLNAEVIGAISPRTDTPAISQSVEKVSRAEAALDDFQHQSPNAQSERALVLYLQLFGAVNAKIESNEKRGLPRASLDVTPPQWAGGVIIAGMSPHGIANPLARKEYEEALGRNRANLEFLNWHIGLKRFRESVVSAFAVTVKNLDLDPEQIATVLRRTHAMTKPEEESLSSLLLAKEKYFPL